MLKQKQLTQKRHSKPQNITKSQLLHTKNNQQKILSKIPSSPLITYHNKQSYNPTQLFSNLTYTSRFHNIKKNNVQTHKQQKMNKNANLKKTGKNLKQILPKNKKQPRLLNDNKFGSQKQLTIQSLNLFSQIMKKSRVQPMQKQRKHFNCSYNPEFYRYFNQKSKKNDSNQLQYVSQSRHRKLMEDFEHHIEFTDFKQVRSRSKSLTLSQQIKQNGKKRNYVLDMFKQSFDLGMDTKYSMKKPYLNRTRSTLHLG